MKEWHVLCLQETYNVVIVQQYQLFLLALLPVLSMHFSLPSTSGLLRAYVLALKIP